MIPVDFEWQRAQHLIHVPSDFLNPPRRPGPELRRQVVNHTNPQLFSCLGDEPVETGKIDNDHRIGAMLGQILLGIADQSQKFEDQRNDRQNSHHRQIRQAKQDVAAGIFHQRTAIPRTLQPRDAVLKFGDQFGGV